MSLWKRTQVQSFGEYKQASSGKPADVSANNPYAEQFDESGINRSKDLVNYMVALQTRKFGESILKSFKYAVLQSQAKRLMGEYESGVLKRAVKIATDVSAHPFTFKVVKKCIPQKT